MLLPPDAHGSKGLYETPVQRIEKGDYFLAWALGAIPDESCVENLNVGEMERLPPESGLVLWCKISNEFRLL